MRFTIRFRWVMSKSCRNQSDIKGCLKVLCSLLKALDIPTLTPEILRKAKFNELEDCATLQSSIVSLLLTSLPSEHSQINADDLANITSSLSPRNLLLVFGSSLSFTNSLKNLILKQCQLPEIHCRERELHRMLKICFEVSDLKSELFLANSFSDCALFKNQLKLAENEFLSCLYDVRSIEQNPSKLNLSLFKLWVCEKRNQSTTSNISQLLKLWLSWQEFIPVFHQWMISVIHLEVQATCQQQSVILGAHILFVREFTTAVSYLQRRVKSLRECLNAECRKAELLDSSPSLSLCDLSEDGLKLLESKIDFLKQRNRVKLDKLLTKVDSNLLLVP